VCEMGDEEDKKAMATQMLETAIQDPSRSQQVFAQLLVQRPGFDIWADIKAEFTDRRVVDMTPAAMNAAIESARLTYAVPAEQKTKQAGQETEQAKEKTAQAKEETSRKKEETAQKKEDTAQLTRLYVLVGFAVVACIVASRLGCSDTAVGAIAGIMAILTGGDQVNRIIVSRRKALPPKKE
jgi:hypothetical protein